MDLKKFYSINSENELIEVIIPNDPRSFLIHAALDYILPSLYHTPRKPSEEEFLNYEPRYLILFIDKDKDLGIEARLQFFDKEKEETFYLTVPEIIAQERKEKLKNMLYMQ